MDLKTFAALIFTFVFIYNVNSQTNDYCNVKTCIDYRKGTQTICAYPNSEPAPACFRGDDLGGGLTDDEKSAILNAHNDYRRYVASGQETQGDPGPQPGAESMPDLTWDDELAFVAQRWADQCNYGHDPCRDVDRFQVGQNVAWMSTTESADTLNPLSAVNMWTNEAKFFDKAWVSKLKGLNAESGEQVGHYTQVVWADTTLIGCGARKYVEPDNNYNALYVVCNYGPTGNFLGSAVYQAV